MKKKILWVYDEIVRPVLYHFREWWPFWFNILNHTPRALFLAHPIELSPTQERILSDLHRDGIATTTLQEFFGDTYTLGDLHTFMNNLPGVEQKDVHTKKDSFLRHLWPIRPTLDFKNPFLHITLDQRVLDIAHSYMQMWVKMKYYDLAKTLPVPEGSQAQFSQKWHRDPEEKRMIKMFIYLTDVDGGCGPFSYIPGSPYGMKPYGNSFPQQPPLGCYPHDSDFSREIPAGAERVMIGNAGTIIFCDTSGLHRGGYATKGERIMATAFYSAPSHSHEVWYSPTNGSSIPKNLSAQAVYALTHP